MAFPCSGLSTLPRGDLEDRGEEREAGLNDLLTRWQSGGKFLSMGHRGQGWEKKETCTLYHVNNDFLVQEDNIGSVGMGGRNGEEV